MRVTKLDTLNGARPGVVEGWRLQSRGRGIRADARGTMTQIDLPKGGTDRRCAI